MWKLEPYVNVLAQTWYIVSNFECTGIGVRLSQDHRFHTNLHDQHMICASYRQPFPKRPTLKQPLWDDHHQFNINQHAGSSSNPLLNSRKASQTIMVHFSILHRWPPSFITNQRTSVIFDLMGWIYMTMLSSSPPRRCRIYFIKSTSPKSTKAMLMIIFAQIKKYASFFDDIDLALLQVLRFLQATMILNNVK